MTKSEKTNLHGPTGPETDDAALPLGVYKPGGRFKEQAMAFFKECVGAETYRKAIASEAGRRHHYVVARAFLDQANWEKFVWIEEYGSLDGFPD